MGNEKEYQCKASSFFMFSFSEEKNANQNIKDLFSRMMEKQSGKEGENSEKEKPS